MSNREHTFCFTGRTGGRKEAVMKRGRPTMLKAGIVQTVVKHIRRWTFDWVAAERAGIDPRTFRRWMKRGSEGVAPYEGFAWAVRKARSEARSDVEEEVKKRHPLSWLRMGPGKDKPGEPGWSQPVAAVVVDAEWEEIGEEDDPAVLDEIERGLREVEEE